MYKCVVVSSFHSFHCGFGYVGDGHALPCVLLDPVQVLIPDFVVMYPDLQNNKISVLI